MGDFADAVKKFVEENPNHQQQIVPAQGQNQVVGELQVMGQAPIIETTETPSTETQAAETTETQAATTETTTEPQTFTWDVLREKFGEDVPDLDALSTAYKSLKDKSAQYDEIVPKYKQFEEVLPKVQNPFVNDTFKKMNDFAKATGISDVEVVSKFVGKTTEQLSSNPVELIALKRMVDNPAISASGVTLSDLKEAVADEYGVSADVKPEDMPIRMKVDVATAATSLNDKIGQGASDDPFTAAARQQETVKQQMEQRFQVVAPQIASAVNSVKEVNIDLGGGQNIAVQVSDAARETIKQEFTNYLVSQNVDVSNPETMRQIQEGFTARAKQLMVDDLLASAVKTVRGVATQQVLKEVHNGGEVVKTVKEVAQPTTESWKETYLKRLNGGR